jgi:hypothetical protein
VPRSTVFESGGIERCGPLIPDLDHVTIRITAKHVGLVWREFTRLDDGSAGGVHGSMPVAVVRVDEPEAKVEDAAGS